MPLRSEESNQLPMHRASCPSDQMWLESNHEIFRRFTGLRSEKKPFYSEFRNLFKLMSSLYCTSRNDFIFIAVLASGIYKN